MKGPVDIEVRPLKAFLIGIRDEKMSLAHADSLVAELEGLVDTLGLDIVAKEVVHVREKSARYGMGTGKAEELVQKALSLGAECMVFDRDISPSQQRNLEELAGISVIDRQELIIQIFASRARTKEAELQVNLAKLYYALPRLQHKYIDLAQQRGGRYGTRGSGETRFETDRRRVEQRIHRLKEELKKVQRQRQVQRRRRERQSIPICALVGYTNAGKSSILNTLTGADVLAENKLFATLDSTSRSLRLPQGLQVLLVDTVGFIQRLPHSLVNAFRSTLEEVSRADILINVLDSSSLELTRHYETTLSVLRELKADNIPMISVLNKIDTLQEADALLKLFPGSLLVSAKTGSGLPELCARLEETLSADNKRMEYPIDK